MTVPPYHFAGANDATVVIGEDPKGA